MRIRCIETRGAIRLLPVFVCFVIATAGAPEAAAPDLSGPQANTAAAPLERIAQEDAPGAELEAGNEPRIEPEDDRLPADDELPPILYGDDGLPEAVLRTRNALLHSARSGMIDDLKKVLDAVAPKLIFSFGGDEDPIAFWKQVSQDGTGRDIMADMIKVFSSGFVHLNAGTADEVFIWPYHFIYPIEDLTPEQEVELYLLLPAEYRQHMNDAGGYIGFRAAIRPSGELVFFVAGD